MSDLRIVIYGTDDDFINSMKFEFKPYSTVTLKLSLTMEEDAAMVALEKFFDEGPYISDLLFINADTMKKVKINGSEILESLISRINILESKGKPSVILFNKYQDSGIQIRYLQEILPNVSLFQSLSPSNSDCFYMSSLVTKDLKSLSKETNYLKKMYDGIRNGTYICFSFNPNLYVYRTEHSYEGAGIQSIKTSPIRPENTFDITHSVAKFFSSHLILFWIFFVFLICTLFIILIKLFKLQHLLA